MLRIRQEHYDSYLGKKIGLSRDRIVSKLRAVRPRETYLFPDDQLKALCSRGMVKAARYGIAREANIYYFVAAMLLCGERFDQDPALPWAQNVLNNQSLDEEIKARLLALEVVVHTRKGL